MTSEHPDDVRTSFSARPGQEPAASQPAAPDRPFRIVIVADARLAKATPVSIDKDSFKSALASASPEIEIELTAPAAADAKPRLQKLKFASLADFDPPGIAAQIPQAAARLQARELILDPQASAAAIREKVAALASADPTLSWIGPTLDSADSAQPPQDSPAPDKDADAGGSLLDMVDVDRSAPSDAATAASMLDPLFKSIAKSGSKDGPSVAGRKRALQRIDHELNAILHQVYAAPSLRTLENVWRSVKFAVDSIDFRSNITLSLLSTPADEITTSVRQTIVDPVYAGTADAPSLILVAKAYSTNHPDIQELSDLAELAASIPCVLVADAATAFLGIERSADIGKLPNFNAYSKEPQYIKWNALRAEPHARFLGLVLGRFLLRPAFAKTDPPKQNFEFDEQPASIEHYCWGSGALALAVLAANSYAKSGWATSFTGPAGGILENLPLREYTTGLGHHKQVAGDLIIPDKRLEEIPLLGLNGLTAVPDKDQVVLCNGLSAHIPPTYQDAPEHVGWLEISLPYQFFTCKISDLLYDLKSELDPTADPELIAGRAIVPIAAAMGVGEQAPNFVQATVDPPEKPGESGHLVVTVTAPRHILPGGIEVNLALPLG